MSSGSGPHVLPVGVWWGNHRRLDRLVPSHHVRGLVSAHTKAVNNALECPAFAKIAGCQCKSAALPSLLELSTHLCQVILEQVADVVQIQRQHLQHAHVVVGVAGARCRGASAGQGRRRSMGQRGTPGR